MSPSESAYPQHPRPAVGAVVFKDHCVLLVQRGHPPGEGQWALPGGNVKLGESLQQAAEREILEETGILIKAGEPVYTFDAIIRDAEGAVAYHYVIVDLTADYVSGTLRPGDDAADARWVPARQLTELAVSNRIIELLRHRFQFGP